MMSTLILRVVWGQDGLNVQLAQEPGSGPNTEKTLPGLTE